MPDKNAKIDDTMLDAVVGGNEKEGNTTKQTTQSYCQNCGAEISWRYKGKPCPKCDFIGE